MNAHPSEWTEVLAALSLATDLANGHDYERTLRTCVVAVGLAEAAGLDHAQVGDTLQATLLRFIGCTSFSHEEALVLGDNIAGRRAFASTDFRDPLAVWRAGGEALQGEHGPARRLLRRGAAMLRASAQLRDLFASQCEVGTRLATRLGARPDVVTALGQIHERWDGRGGPAGLRAEELAVVTRVMQVASLSELVFHRVGPRDGIAAVVDIVRRRSGSALDPRLGATMVAHASALLSALPESPWDAFVALGQRFALVPAERGVADVVEAFADFADLTSVFTLGHSRAVAAAAERAAENLGLPAEDRSALRHAALLHDLGRVAVPTGLWEKRGKLSAADWERIRMHAYYGERVLERAPSLRAAAAIVRTEHERCDGSGYPRSMAGDALSMAAHILAAADVHCALLEDRPQRPARSAAQAEQELRSEVAAGRLHRHAVDAVLGSARASATGGGTPAGLTAREVEVLGWVARGETNKEVAARLDISARTVGHHLAHAYAKIGVSTRAAAALFVVEHGLLPTRRTP